MSSKRKEVALAGAEAGKETSIDVDTSDDSTIANNDPGSKINNKNVGPKVEADAHSMKKSRGPTKTTPQMWRVIFQWLSEHKGTDSRLLARKNRHALCEELQTRLKEDIAPEHLVQLTPEQLQKKIEGLDRRLRPGAKDRKNCYSLQEMIVGGPARVWLQKYVIEGYTEADKALWTAGGDPFEAVASPPHNAPALSTHNVSAPVTAPGVDHSEKTDNDSEPRSPEAISDSTEGDPGASRRAREEHQHDSSPRLKLIVRPESAADTERQRSLSSTPERDTSSWSDQDYVEGRNDLKTDNGPKKKRRKLNNGAIEPLQARRKPRLAAKEPSNLERVKPVSDKAAGGQELQAIAQHDNNIVVEKIPVAEIVAGAQRSRQTGTPENTSERHGPVIEPTPSSTRKPPDVEEDTDEHQTLKASTEALRAKLATKAEQRGLAKAELKGPGDCMSGLEASITEAVKNRALLSGMRFDEPVTDGVLSVIMELPELRKLIVEANCIHTKEELRRALVDRPKTPLLFSQLLCAVVGAVVAKEALEKSSIPEEARNMFEYSLEAVSTLDKVGAATVLRKAWQQYIEERVDPGVEARAEALCRLLNEIIERLISSQRSAHRADPLGAWTGNSAPLEVGDAAMGISHGIDWRQIWEHTIVDIFQSALKLRVDMDSSSGEFCFTWPVHGSAAHTKTGGLACTMLPMFPRLEGRNQLEHGGSTRKWFVVYPGKVFHHSTGAAVV